MVARTKKSGEEKFAEEKFAEERRINGGVNKVYSEEIVPEL